MQDLVEGEVVKLAVERKHLSDLFKMAAYQVESDLVGLLGPHYCRAQDEGRALIQNALATDGDIQASRNELHAALARLGSPHQTKALRGGQRELVRCGVRDQSHLSPHRPGHPHPRRHPRRRRAVESTENGFSCASVTSAADTTVNPGGALFVNGNLGDINEFLTLTVEGGALQNVISTNGDLQTVEVTLSADLLANPNLFPRAVAG